MAIVYVCNEHLSAHMQILLIQYTFQCSNVQNMRKSQRSEAVLSLILPWRCASVIYM